ncbi:hypothetical protein K4K94_07860 [Phaeobacter inhibens]|nr:hypothetical protein K4K94_07860 [Phaeobacter inhibens]
MPDVGGVEYLLDMMMPEALGWCSFDQMGGAAPIAWTEINAFSRAAGLDLEPWEVKQLRAMSAAYVQGLARGREPMKVSPAFDDQPDEDPGVELERQRLSDNLNASLSALAG